MKISKTAYVARTSHDKDRANRLVVPECGAIEIRVKKLDDSKMSKSFLPEGSQPARKPTDGGEDAFAFAPGPQLNPDTWVVDKARTDPVKIWYHLFNPHGVVTEAKLQLFRRWDDKPMWERELKDDELLDGEHELEFEVDDDSGGKKKVVAWDGAVKKTDEFPDAFITTEHSPYRLRLQVKGDGINRTPVVWTYLHVLVHKLKLEWGDLEAIENDADKRKPFEMLKDKCDEPSKGDDTKGRIYLVSHIFMRSESEMFDNTQYTAYETMWGDGPQIPVYAKVWVRDSSGNEVLAPKALGKTKFMWDWESKTDKLTGFVAEALDYDKDKTKPKGYNCHVDRGGKRGDDTKAVFPEQTGYDPKDTLDNGVFPFKVVKTDETRKWAAYSTAWSSGKLAAKTGVMFRPSRMGGEKYKFTVYSAHEITESKRKPRLNVDSDAPLKIEASLKAESGTFVVWRKMYMRRRMTKSGTDTVGVGGIKAYYEPAFIDIEDKTTGVEQYPSAEWNSEFSTLYSGWSDFDKYFVDPSVNQYGQGAHGIHFRTRLQFKNYIQTTFSMTAAATQTWMDGQGIGDKAKYYEKCEGLAIAALQALFDRKMPADDGISIFHTAYSTQPALQDSSLTDGLAHIFASGSSSKCAFLWLAPPSLYAGRPQGVDATPAHEIGHHLMLPHPANTAENDGSANNYDAHDKDVDNCLMSYLNGARTLCGLCRLRLRGWDKSKLSTTSATNKKA